MKINRLLGQGDIGTFYGQASLHVPNKYDMVLYGEYIDTAIMYLKKSSSSKRQSYYTPSPPSAFGANNVVSENKLDSVSFERWYSNHVIPNFKYIGEQSGKLETGYAIRFKWACSKVAIPLMNATTSNDPVNIETYKQLSHRFVQKYGTQDISISVVEEQGMMWYQFFNALANVFFHPELLTPRASVFKLSAQLIPLLNLNRTSFERKESDVMTADIRDWNHDVSIDYAQVFEYNSIVLKDFPDISLSQSADSPMKYEGITFYCPNPFQKSLKSRIEGMRDGFTDKYSLLQSSNYRTGNLQYPVK